MAVGRALSWWEGAEDVLMGLIRWLCQESEPTAFAAYVASPRSRRTAMLKEVLQRYEAAFSREELDIIRAGLKELDQLAATRNEIAHGHCSEFRSVIDGAVTMSGAYLLPSLNEGHWHERDMRYAHTASTIADFEAQVRAVRWRIFEAYDAARMRRQEARNGSGYKLDIARQICRRVELGQMTPLDAERSLTNFIGTNVDPSPEGSSVGTVSAGSLLRHE